MKQLIGVYIHAINRMDHVPISISFCMNSISFLGNANNMFVPADGLMGEYVNATHTYKHSPYYKGIKLLIVPFCRENHRDIIRTPPKNVMSLIINSSGLIGDYYSTAFVLENVSLYCISGG